MTANITPHRDQETTIGYDENDGVNSLEHELAFGIDICFERCLPLKTGFKFEPHSLRLEVICKPSGLTLLEGDSDH